MYSKLTQDYSLTFQLRNGDQNNMLRHSIKKKKEHLPHKLKLEH